MKKWKECKIIDLFDVKIGGDLNERCFSKNRDNKFSFPIFSNSLVNKGFYGFTSNPKFSGNSITITGRGEIGRAEFRSEFYDAIVRLIVLIPKTEVDCRFLTFYINHRINFAVESTGVPQLTAPKVAKTKVYIPQDFREQSTIASILCKVDEAITATNNSIFKAERLKKALMQNLLCGKLKTDGTWRKDDEFYKDEKFGDTPIGWHWGRLSEIADVIAGQSPAGEFYNEDGKGVPILNGPTEFTDLHPIPVQYTTKTTKLCEVGDILFTVRGSSTGRMNIADQQYCIGRGIAAIRNKEDSNIDFIYYTLITIADKILAEARGSGTTFPNVNRGELLKKWVLIPKDEQAVISKMIKSVDVILKSKQAKIEKLERLKKSLIQNLLTGKVRVKLPQEKLKTK